ncbi:hypothetical protein [Polynucleobacter necessarius]|uniref:hypothetical protein n=1 Tax=Polynucleobacter necessarius TaxID=576610 RepID=UPI001E4D1007|nr:hypothetical protein [Polynucleobacter necessarius]
MRVIHEKNFLVYASAGLVALAGCASKPPAPVVKPTVIGQVPADSPKNPVINAEALKSESKSIAVTDIYFKKEGKNLTYIEETRTTTDNSITSTLTPKTIEVDADKANASALTGGPNSSVFPVKFTDLSDPKATSPGTAVPATPASRSSAK